MTRSDEQTGPGVAVPDAEHTQISEALALTADVDQVLSVLVRLAPLLRRIREKSQAAAREVAGEYIEEQDGVS